MYNQTKTAKLISKILRFLFLRTTHRRVWMHKIQKWEPFLLIQGAFHGKWGQMPCLGWPSLVPDEAIYPTISKQKDKMHEEMVVSFGPEKHMTQIWGERQRCGLVIWTLLLDTHSSKWPSIWIPELWKEQNNARLLMGKEIKVTRCRQCMKVEETEKAPDEEWWRKWHDLESSEEGLTLMLASKAIR